MIAITDAALDGLGGIAAGGVAGSGGSGAPSDTGYSRIYSTANGFSAIKAAGQIAQWGHSEPQFIPPPSGTGFVAVYSTTQVDKRCP